MRSQCATSFIWLGRLSLHQIKDKYFPDVNPRTTKILDQIKDHQIHAFVLCTVSEFSWRVCLYTMCTPRFSKLFARSTLYKPYNRVLILLPKKNVLYIYIYISAHVYVMSDRSWVYSRQKQWNNPVPDVSWLIGPMNECMYVSIGLPFIYSNCS